MNIPKRALLYLRRNKSTIVLTLILVVFFILLIIGSAMISSADKEINNVTDALCNSFNLTMIIDRDDPSLWTEEVVEKDGTTTPQYHSPVSLTDSMAEEILQIDGISEYNGESMGLMHTDLKVKEGLFSRDYSRLISDPEYYEDYINSNMTEDDLIFEKYARQTLNVLINTSSEKNELFRNGAFEVIEGRHLLPDDQFKTLVSEDFAKRNNLKIGDAVPVDLNKEYIDAVYFNLDWIKPFKTELEVVGIYRINFQMEVSEYTVEEEMPENTIIINALTEKEIEKLDGSIPNERKDLVYRKLTFFVDDPNGIDSIIEHMKQIDGISWGYVDVTKDDTDYQPIKDTLNGIKNMGLLIAIGAGIGCFFAVFLLIIMRTRQRSREAGILLANGIGKKEILLQMLFEILITSVIAFVIAVIISGMLMQPLGNAVNDSFSKEEGDRYEAYYDDYLNIVAKQGNADINLEYDFTEGIVPAAICIPLFLVPVLISSKKLLKKKPYDLLSE